jgi:hypothetical protein
MGNRTGVDIYAAPKNTIGGTTAGAGNVNSGNLYGVTISGDNATGNRILSNSIYDNGTLGIDLGGTGVTPNDPPSSGTSAPTTSRTSRRSPLPSPQR